MICRVHIVIRGAVQGVGFRPFIYKLAKEMDLKGFVLNSSLGVFIEAESDRNILQNFILRIEKEKPPLSLINSLEATFLDPLNYNEFEIRESKNEEETSALILPDISTCPDCLDELFDPENRRYLYPFINCTNCGPRFSIIESLPYDRPNTSMKEFAMCDKCREEYENPMDRRFHAQPIACPNCGPQIELWNEKGELISEKNNALLETVRLINDNKIIALKGLGGFQLIVDASHKSAVEKLRMRKKRDGKPFALMFPDIEMVNKICEVTNVEKRLLTSPEKPIVLLRKIVNNPLNLIAENVAPNNPYLGIMLPYTPLHYLLMNKLNKPVIATSGNISDEPMCIDNQEALNRLNGIADYFLVNNRPIVRHVDDSIVREINGRELIIRRARGFAPLPLQTESNSLNKSILAVGGHLKNTISLLAGNNLFTSQHIGDLSTKESNSAFIKVINDFKILYNKVPQIILTDKHPEYISTKYANTETAKNESIQHHYAHIAACRLENKVMGDALGVSWDGTGYGLDGNIWGSEFFISKDNSHKHIGQFRNFRLPGGDKAVKEPRRTSLSVLYEIYGPEIDRNLFDNNFTDEEFGLIISMLNKKINSPITSSAGRLFDAVSSLLGICHISTYEAEAAMQLEFNAEDTTDEIYPFRIIEQDIFTIDWQLIIESILLDLKSEISVHNISAKFHNTLSQIILTVANKIKIDKIILSGGCFQNKLLTEKTIKILSENNYKVYWHQRIPPNDGGISVGQIAAYLYNNTDDRGTKKFKEDFAIKES